MGSPSSSFSTSAGPAATVSILSSTPASAASHRHRQLPRRSALHPELYQRFSDDEGFRKWLADAVFGATYGPIATADIAFGQWGRSASEGRTVLPRGPWLMASGEGGAIPAAPRPVPDSDCGVDGCPCGGKVNEATRAQPQSSPRRYPERPERCAGHA